MSKRTHNTYVNVSWKYTEATGPAGCSDGAHRIQHSTGVCV